MKKVIVLLILTSLIIVSCTTSKSLAKKAKKMEDISQYQSASELYFLSLKKNPQNIDALSGMKRTGGNVLKNHLNKFSTAKLNENYKEATYAFIDAVAYQKKIKTVNINLPISDFQKQDFKIVKNEYLNQEYETGLKLIEKEQFSEAEIKFNEIFRFDKDYKDVKELRNIAYLEPYYREAEKNKTNREYRKAYYSYQKILSRVPDYKDSKANCNYVLKKGRINIMIINKKEDYKFKEYTKSIKSYTESAILNEKDPFIKMVDREHMESLLQEQDLVASGLADEEGALELGNIKGAQYALSVDVTGFTHAEKPLRRTAYKGYEQYREKFYNKSTEQNEYRTKYKRVNYYTFSGSRTVSMTTHYKILSLKTGEIIRSKMIDEHRNAETNYLTYEGDINKLYPSKDGNVNTSYSAHQELINKSKNSHTLESKSQLTHQLYNIISKQITKATIDEFSK